MNWNSIKQQGFSLLEILVAFSILAISLTILLNIFASGMNNASVAEDYNQAIQIAESLMAKTGLDTPLKIGHTSGTLQKYQWQVLIEPFSFAPEIDTTTLPANLFKVKVIVTWDKQRQVKLVSLKLSHKTL